MDLCPVEIWQNIFRLVCLDSGQTDRSLSLVPKYFNRDPKRFIFQSTYLKNIDQMETLAAILDRIRPNLQLVRHLYIFTYDLEMEQLGSDIRKKLQRKWGLEAQSRRKKYIEEVFRQAMYLIFRRTGRHLKTLYVLLCS